MALEQKTLILNSTYEPLSIVSWRRAIILFYMRKVEALESYDIVVHSTTQTWKVPAVVRLLTYVSRGFQPIKFSRNNVYLRDRYTCQYCGKVFQPSKLTCDHVIPKSQGGESDWINIVTCCTRCNSIKGDKTPEAAGMHLVRKPVKPSLPHTLKLVLGMNDTPETWKKYLFQK